MKYEVVVKVRFIVNADNRDKAVNTALNLIISDEEDIDEEELSYTLCDVENVETEVLSVKEA